MGEGHRALVVAEVAQAHDGSLGLAHAHIEAAARAGADAVKFQTHIAAAESTRAEPWRVLFSRQDASRYEYWRRLEFTREQWAGLRAHAEERGMLFLSSPFSCEAVDLLSDVGVGAFKVASGEVSDVPMLDRILATGLPVLLSTGMSPLAEIDAAVERIRAARAPLVVMQCTSLYPCPPQKVGLNMLGELARRYGGPVGLSDHSGSIVPGLAAVSLGICVLEVHLALSRDMFGPDVSVSLVPCELRQLVDGVRMVEAMRAHPVDKDEIARELAPLRDTFTKSVAARRDLDEGVRLAAVDLVAKKPGTGIPAARLSDVVGRRLRRRVVADELLAWEDLA